jgi:3-oxoadipate enol-lactonase
VPYCDVNGINLYYESHGSGPPIVFVHGMGGNHASWFRQIQAFAVDHRVVVYDQRGFGNSNDPQRSGRSEMVGDLAALLDSLSIERAILVGQSMGGGTCTGFTCRHPSRVAALVLADSLVGIELPEEVATMVAEARSRADGLTQPVRVLGPATREKRPEQAILYTQLSSFNDYDVTNIPGVFQTVGLRELAQTSVPILYIVGSDDILFPPTCVRRVHQQIANSQFIEVQGVGHSVYFEDATTFNDVLRTFIAALN